MNRTSSAAPGPDGAGGRLDSPSFPKNFAPIRDELSALLAGRAGTVLEIGSGPGQHVAHFAAAIDWVTWQPSDPEPAHRASIAAWRAHLAAARLAAPLALNAADDWAARAQIRALAPLAAVYAQNVVHIAPWEVAEGLVAGAGAALPEGGLLILYGPFREGGAHTGPGNARFDAALRARDPRWGVRDVGDLDRLAAAAGLAGPEIRPMPSDNRILVWRRG